MRNCIRTRAGASRPLSPPVGHRLASMASVGHVPSAVVDATEPGSAADGVLFNPRTYDGAGLDPETRRLMRATVDWFEERGKRGLKEDDRGPRLARRLPRVRARKGSSRPSSPRRPTPATSGQALGHDPDRRLQRDHRASTVSPTGTRGRSRSSASARSGRATTRRRGRARRSCSRTGAIFAFGLSEKEHGADIYSTDMLLTPDGDGASGRAAPSTTSATATRAGMVSVFGRRADVEGPDGYVFFAADSRHPAYQLVKNVVDSPIVRQRVPPRGLPGARRGRPAHRAGGLRRRAEHRQRRQVQPLHRLDRHLRARVVRGGHPRPQPRSSTGRAVTDFPHVRQSFADAYARLVAMKLFSDRAVDYFRSASPDDRRYLLFNPMTKMKVTTEGEKVIDLLWDVIAAKGFEKDTYFAQAARDIRGAAQARGHGARQPRADPQVHARLPLQPGGVRRPSRPATTRPTTRSSSSRARPAASARSASTTGAPPTTRSRGAERRPLRGAGRRPCASCSTTAAPDEEQSQDLDFLLALGQLFTLVVYGQLILEQARLTGLDDGRRSTRSSTSSSATSPPTPSPCTARSSTTEAQQAWALASVRKPVVDEDRFASVWEQARGLAGAYEMRR